MGERVSVLISTFNYARYLPQCLESVLKQTRLPDEIVVVDDGSMDGTPELMKQFPGIRYVYQQNAGKALAFSRALSLSSGEIVCHLDADDYWELDKLERVLHCLEQDSRIGGVIHEVSYVDAQGRGLHFPWNQKHPTEPLLLKLDQCEDASFLYPLPKMRGHFFGVPNSCCVRRRCVEDLFPLPPEVGGAVDGVMVAGALRFGMTYLPAALAAYRIHGNNAGFGNVASNRETMYMWEFLLRNPSFRNSLSSRHAKLLRAKIFERKAYVASRTGQNVLECAWAGVLVPLILAANGRCCNWRHLALPFACLLPIKRSHKKTAPKSTPALQPKFIHKPGAEMKGKAQSAKIIETYSPALSVSIVIPTRNRSAILALCLNALPAGTCELPPPAVIVSDDCSSDDTGKTVEEFRNASGWNVTYVRQGRPMGANAARNAGLNVAGGDIIVFIDDDVLVTEGWLCKLLTGLSKECPVVSGPVHLTLEGSIVGRHREEISSYLSEILSPPHGRQGEIVPAACNMAAYRSVFDNARFDESVRPPIEENDWLERAGVRAGFVQDARVWHHKTREEANPRQILAGAWRGGNEGGWWLRERVKIPAGERRTLTKLSLQTSLRAFGHAALRGCWGGAVVGIGELSRALALAGIVKRRRAPQNWR